MKIHSGAGKAQYFARHVCIISGAVGDGSASYPQNSQLINNINSIRLYKIIF